MSIVALHTGMDIAERICNHTHLTATTGDNCYGLIFDVYPDTHSKIGPLKTYKDTDNGLALIMILVTAATPTCDDRVQIALADSHAAVQRRVNLMSNGIDELRSVAISCAYNVHMPIIVHCATPPTKDSRS